MTADVNNPVTIEVGGSALSPSLRVPASPRRGGENIQVASLFMLPGMLAGLTNSAIADSNGEHLYLYHSDHLGTPLFLTDTDGVVVWRGEYLPFGEVFSEDTDPDGDGVEVEQPFRFPGQYEDAETGLYYNYFRDYDPTTGRYIEADPIGSLEGNSATFDALSLFLHTSNPTPFAYSGNNPVNSYDEMGAAQWHFDYTNTGERLIHYGKYRFNRFGELVEHTGKVIGKAKGPALKALKYLRNVKPYFFSPSTPFFPMIIIDPCILAPQYFPYLCQTVPSC